MSIWPWINWINIYTYHLHPLISYFDVHQGYKVLTHPLTSFSIVPWHSMRNSPRTTEQVLNLWEKWGKKHRVSLC